MSFRTHAIAETTKNAVDGRLDVLPVLDTLLIVWARGTALESRPDVGAGALGGVLKVRILNGGERTRSGNASCQLVGSEEVQLICLRTSSSTLCAVSNGTEG
jgi:hypothetical protein